MAGQSSFRSVLGPGRPNCGHAVGRVFWCKGSNCVRSAAFFPGAVASLPFACPVPRYPALIQLSSAASVACLVEPAWLPGPLLFPRTCRPFTAGGSAAMGVPTPPTLLSTLLPAHPCHLGCMWVLHRARGLIPLWSPSPVWSLHWTTGLRAASYGRRPSSDPRLNPPRPAWKFRMASNPWCPPPLPAPPPHTHTPPPQLLGGRGRDFCYSKTIRGLKTSPGLVKLEHVFEGTFLSDRNSSFRQGFCPSKRLGHVHRSFWCLLPHPHDRKWLYFVWRNKVFQCQALPFALALTRWIFINVVRGLCTFLHQRGVRLNVYLDDCLILVFSADQFHRHTWAILELCTKVDFHLNPIKS